MHDFAAHAAPGGEINKFVQHLLRFFLRVAVQIHIGHHRPMAALQAADVVLPLAVFAERGRRLIKAAGADVEIIFLCPRRFIFGARFDGRCITRRRITLRVFQRHHFAHGSSKIHGFRFAPALRRFGFNTCFFCLPGLLAQHFQSVFKIAAHAFTCSLSFFHMNILCRRLPIAYILHNCLAEIPVGNHGGNVCGNLFCAAQAALRF